MEYKGLNYSVTRCAYLKIHSDVISDSDQLISKLPAFFFSNSSANH